MNSVNAFDTEQLERGVAQANVPTLLMVLVQLTGEQKWLADPYRPSKSRGLSDNETGGFTPDVQSEIRAAALSAIVAWKSGTPIAIPEPSPELIIEMISVTMGEPVPPEYAPMIAAEIEVANSFPTGDAPNREPAELFNVPEGFSVVIIGAGISGICAAVRLQGAGVPFTIIERNADVGGVWLENRYPGAAVDTPNHLYCFSFAPHDWSRYFAGQSEILSYVKKVATDFEIRPHVKFDTEVVGANYDAELQRWIVRTRGPEGEQKICANIVLSAVGAFNKPKQPHVEGIDGFSGPSFHTANWPTDLDLTGKRVAVIGNGASAMQVVPAIADAVESIVVFQHSPQWASPFPQFKQAVPEEVRYVFREVPLYYAWYRARMAWIFNDRLYHSLQRDPDWEHPERSLNPINDAHRRQLTAYIEAELGERVDELRDKVLPTYPPFGKRMLLDNGWFRTIAREHITIETSRVASVSAHSVVADSGNTYEVDLIVWATGFDVVRFLAPMDIVGLNGTRLEEAWEGDDARAYLGTSIPEFPNFFVLYGPNTQFGHGGSLITVMERQVHYFMSALKQMLDSNVGSLVVKQEVHDRYNELVDAKHEQMVWTHPGMDTYYRNGRGRVVVNNPFRMQEFWEFTEAADFVDFHRRPRVGSV
jgi:4-hydroxyacetophenone monooxygenase